MTRSYRTAIPPTPGQRFFASTVFIAIRLLVAGTIVGALARGLYVLCNPDLFRDSLAFDDFACVLVVIVFGVLGFAVAACLLTWALDYCWRWLRWVYTGVWVVYSEDIDDIESA